MAAADNASVASTFAQWLIAAGGLGGLVTGALALRRVRAQNRKDDSDAADVVAGAAVELVGPLSAQLRAVQEELTEARTKVKQLSHELDVAIARAQAAEGRAEAAEEMVREKDATIRYLRTNRKAT